MQLKQRAAKREVHGILLLDKPTGMTSNAALQQVKYLFTAKKAGHTGSLDPLANGMLPICFGEATKFSQYLLEADKIYEVTAKVGVKTTTGDTEGEIVAEKSLENFNKETLQKVLVQFQGEISQIPSMFSALKHQGQPLYKLARQGIAVERAARNVTIYALNLTEVSADYFSFIVHCSKGTYVRTLVEDIGEALGCGAHVTALRRTQVAKLPVDRMITMQQITDIVAAQGLTGLDALLTPIDLMLQDWSAVNLSEAAAYYLKQGQPVIVPYAPTSGWVRLFLHGGRFIGVGEIIDDGRVAPRRLVQIR